MQLADPFSESLRFVALQVPSELQKARGLNTLEVKNKKKNSV
jgi:hypothetical protein